MNNRDDQSIDNELRGVAMAATHEHEQTVSADETEAALAAVRSRLAGGDLGGAPPSIDLVRDRQRRSPLILLAAAAAVVGMIGLGLVAVVGGDRTNETFLTPNTAPEPQPTGPTTEGDIAAPPTAAETTVAVAPEPGATAFLEQTTSVDASNPPPLIEPTVWRSVPIDAANVESLASIGVAADAVLVKQSGIQSITVLDRAGDGRSDVAIDEDISSITAGPAGSVYGLGDPVFAPDNPVAPTGFRFVGISLVDGGPADAGQVFAFVETDPNSYLELPPYAFGTGETGVVDRTRNNGDTILAFAAGRDDAIDEPGVPFPQFARNDEGFSDPSTGRIEIVDRGWVWNLDITRDPANNSGFVGPSAPAPTTGNRVIYFERIGAAESDEDFSRSAMPVVAVLNPDGSGRWVRLPDDWDVVASDVWGTVLMRTTPTDFEFALLDDVLAASDVEQSPPSEPTQPSPNDSAALAIPDNCVGDLNCTQLSSTEDGRIVAYDPTDETLRVYDADGQAMELEVPLVEPISTELPYLVHIGPGDVAYVAVDTPNFDDPSSDLIAIPLVGPRAGAEVMRYTGLDGSGDSSLMAQKNGLVQVNCCGAAVPRPTPDALLYHYVDDTATRITSTAPTFRLDLGEAGNNLVRINEDGSSTFFNLPTVLQSPRDVPRVVPTDDGGALATDYVFVGSRQYSVMVDFNTDWPEFDIDNSDVYVLDDAEALGAVLLEPSGTVVVRDQLGNFLRKTPDQLGMPGWPGQVEINTTAGVVAAPGLNDYIGQNLPAWADDPNLFGVQFERAVHANESVLIELDPTGQELAITTSGFLDDSVTASRIAVRIERAADGLLRFVSGTYGWQCAAGRGHQDFSIEPCI